MRRVTTVFASLALLSAFASPAAQAQSSTNAELCATKDDGVASPQQRIAACSALIETLKDQPQALAAALTNRGTTYWYIDKVDLAIADLDRAIALDPNNARAFGERSNAYRSQGRLDRALADANEAVRLDPNDPRLSTIAATSSTITGSTTAPSPITTKRCGSSPTTRRRSWTAASPTISRRNTRPRSRITTSRSGSIRSGRAPTPNAAPPGRSSAATTARLADETEAIKLDPLAPGNFDNRGLSYAENGDYDRAVADYNEAIRLSPQANFLTNRGDSYNFKHDYDRAIADYDRALQLNPGFYLAYNNRGAAYAKKGDLDHAIVDYEAALRINPQLDTAGEGLATARQERDRRAALNSDRLLPTFDCKRTSRGGEGDLLRPPICPGSTARSTTPTRRRSPSSTARRRAAPPRAARFPRRAQQIVR